MQNNGWYSESEENEYKESIRKEVMSTLIRSEKVPKPTVKNMFTDVYEELPPHLMEQYNSLIEHISKHKDKYPDNFETYDNNLWIENHEEKDVF